MNLAETPARVPFLYLLVALLALILAVPLLEDRAYGLPLVQLVFSIMMAAAVHAASERPRNRLVALALAAPWLVLVWSNELGLWRTPAWIDHVLVIALSVLVGCVVLGKVTRAKEIDLNVLCGGIALYLLIAVMWAFSYRLIDDAAPGSLAAGRPPAAWHDYIYFSLTTITTLGYGDILPKSPFAAIWAAMETVTGVLYMAVLVARLVSLYRR